MGSGEKLHLQFSLPEFAFLNYSDTDKRNPVIFQVIAILNDVPISYPDKPKKTINKSQINTNIQISNKIKSRLFEVFNCGQVIGTLPDMVLTHVRHYIMLSPCSIKLG